MANDSEQREYVVDLSGNAAWTGTVTRLRFDVSNAATSGSAVIDYIRVGR
jgi:hypothetical protein